MRAPVSRPHPLWAASLPVGDKPQVAVSCWAASSFSSLRPATVANVRPAVVRRFSPLALGAAHQLEPSQLLAHERGPRERVVLAPRSPILKWSRNRQAAGTPRTKERTSASNGRAAR
jgi:hypothetical protein